MIKKIKRILIISTAFSSLLALVAAPTLVYAATGTSPATVNDGITNGICQGVQASTGQSGTLDLSGNPPAADASNCTNDTTAGITLGHIISEVINIMSILVGVICVIMIIVGGLKYVTSGGESNNVSGAKNTIVYALVGLVVVAMAQVIVHFVLSRLAS